MKKIVFLTALAAATILQGCTKIKKLADINFDIPYSMNVSVPKVEGGSGGIGLPIGVPLPFPKVAVATDAKTYTAQYGTATNLIVTAYLKALSIDILSPPNTNFDFLNNVELYLSAPGLPELLVASQTNIPKGVTRLNMTTNTDVNLKNYFLQDTIYFRLYANINAIPPSGEELTIASVFHVLANPLN